MIDSEHVPSGEQESYTEVSNRIEVLCAARNENFNLQSDRLNHHRRLANQMRQLEDDIITTLSDKLGRVSSGLSVDNATQRLTDLQVSELYRYRLYNALTLTWRWDGPYKVIPFNFRDPVIQIS